MVSTISSRTPEGAPNRCPICHAAIRLEASPVTNDAPCPACGALLWFLQSGDDLIVYDAEIATPVADKLMQIVAEQLGINPDQITPDSLTKEIGADSLDVVELVMELEEHFGITLRESDAEQIKTIADAIRYIIERLHERE